jgi:8-oxo-dGTP pyrophosphatase MutT (NUDIX family)
MGSDVFARLVMRLSDQEPRRRNVRLAAVSVMLKDKEAPSVLLIRRAERPGDPWSGQIAFPGGKMQPGDGTARGTAVRETLEEVGVDLNRSSEFLGYASATMTHTGTMLVVPSVFFLTKEVAVRQNEEVASHRWVELGRLFSPEAKATHQMSYGDSAVELPAFEVGDYVVWGLTHRIVSLLLQDAG